MNSTRRISWSPFAASMAIVVITVVAIGCSSQSVPPDWAAPAIDVVRSTEKGPVRLAVEVDRTSAQVAERITMTLAVRAPQGVAVRFPEPTNMLGEFDVIDVRDKLDLPDGDERRFVRTYELENLASGEHEIPPIDVQYTDRRDGAAITDTIQSQPIAINITSVLEGQTDPLAFRDIKGEVELPKLVGSNRAWIAYTLGGGLALALAALGLIAWQRRRKNLTPAAWALAELAELEQSDLPAQGLVEEFYCGLTDIVRGYLERQFAIQAPLLTTEEFLQAMKHEPALNEIHRESLAEFLAVADMVKFARFEPGSSEANETINVARQFVVATAQHEQKNDSHPAEVAA